MKAEPLKASGIGYARCEPSEATHLRLHMPGPLMNRILPVQIKGDRHGTRNWSWNGDTEKPTVKPSILTRGSDENGDHVCHSWVNDGKVIFQDDCSHEFVDQTLDLLDID